jgi:hypothetical protein
MHHAAPATQKLTAYTSVGTPPDAASVRRSFRRITNAYLHQLKPVISTGATAMNTIFGKQENRLGDHR